MRCLKWSCDVADAGIDKTKRLADRVGVHINVFKADILDFRLSTEFDILYSNGVLHYSKPELRNEIFTNYKQFTKVGGIHVFSAFVQKPFISPPPEIEPTAYNWTSGELFGYYHDWKIERCEEIVFDCNSSGIQHQHAMNRIIGKKCE